MSKFEDYNKLADPLKLPINGKMYTIPEVGAADGIKFTTSVGEEDTAALSDEEFFTMFLGPAYAEMVADNVPGPAIIRAAMTALADFQRGRATAEVMWATGGDPKAVEQYLTPNRASRRSTSTGGAKKTPSRASTKVTTSPQT